MFVRKEQENLQLEDFRFNLILVSINKIFIKLCWVKQKAKYIGINYEIRTLIIRYIVLCVSKYFGLPHPVLLTHYHSL